MKKDCNCNALLPYLSEYGTVVHCHHSQVQFNFYFMARTTYFESLTDNTVTNVVQLSSLFDALRDSNLLNLCKLSLYLAQPIYTGADFKPIVNSNPNLNCIYINEDGGFDDEHEKDLVLEVLRMLVKTFSKCCPIYLRIWVARE